MMDMTGKLIIKAGLKDDIRRIPIHNEDITYDELILMMQRVFKGKLNTTDEILIKYKDEDGDLITLSDDSDLAFAIQSGGKILKITLFVNNASDGSDQGSGANQKKEIKRQLQYIQQCLEDVITRLDGFDSESFAADTTRSPDKKKNDARERESRSSSRCSGTGNVPAGSKEFDPLTGTQKSIQQSIPTISGSPRSGTPGSAVPGSATNSFLQASPKHLQNSAPNSSIANVPLQPYANPPQGGPYTPGVAYQNVGTPPQQHQTSLSTYNQMPPSAQQQQTQSQEPQQSQSQQHAQPHPYQNYQGTYNPYQTQGQTQPPIHQPPQQPQQPGSAMYYPSGFQQPPSSSSDASQRPQQQQPQMTQPTPPQTQPYVQSGENVPRLPGGPGTNPQYSVGPPPPGPVGPPAATGGVGQNMYARGGLNSKQASYQLGYR